MYKLVGISSLYSDIVIKKYHTLKYALKNIYKYACKYADICEHIVLYKNDSIIVGVVKCGQ